MIKIIHSSKWAKSARDQIIILPLFSSEGTIPSVVFQRVYRIHSESLV